MTKVFYPGSFDPITKGHMNIIEQASELFEEVVIGVLQNPQKKDGFFTLEERFQLITALYKNHSNIRVVSGEGASTDLALLYGCRAIIRGLRGLSDFDYEIQLSQVNKQLSENRIQTVCLFADSNYQFISSSMVKSVLVLGKKIEPYVDAVVAEKMYNKIK